MSQTHVGKILFIDDKYDESIQKAVISLVEKGLSVQFWDGKGDFPNTIQNVRVVVLDLDLAELGSRTGPEFYLSAVQVLNRIPGPYVVIILSVDFQKDDPFELESYYKAVYKCPISGYISEDGLTKAEEREDPSRLIGIINSCIKTNALLNLVQSWEMVVDGAKDKALSDLITKEVEDAIFILINSLKKDFGIEGASRELIEILMRLVSRRTNDGPSFETLKTIIDQTRYSIPANYPSLEDTLLFNRIMFYEPHTGERIFTGDIFRLPSISIKAQTKDPLERENKYENYAIIMTPMCDIIQDKAKKLLVCVAFPLDEKYFDDPVYPPFKIDNAVIKFMEEENDKTESQLKDFLRIRYLERKRSLPENLYTIWNFKDTGDIFGICFDFHNVRSVAKSEISKWERISRLDSPFLGEMVQKYNSLMSRTGTLAINNSPNKIKEYVNKLK